MDLDLTDIGLRLGAATLAGALIGINRDLAQKPIGVRTLGLVALFLLAAVARVETLWDTTKPRK